ncbi:hypothetical protein EON62_01895 [archaeon]|nr:MAG: hypothetical protein EON62_01895 [archaeon]
MPRRDTPPPSRRRNNECSYCDAFTERDNLYIVMEFAEGGDIGRQIEKYKKANKYVKEDTIWSYTIQICRALNEMHSRSILHRVRTLPSPCAGVVECVRRMTCVTMSCAVGKSMCCRSAHSSLAPPRWGKHLT